MYNATNNRPSPEDESVSDKSSLHETARQREIWEEEFAAAARRPLAVRLKYAFVHTHKPILDDAPYRSFERMADYRQWCETQLPWWLGYGRV
jgi:hypothetical protein